MTFSILTLAAFNQKYSINIVRRLVDIDKKMRSVHIELSYRNCKKFLLIQIVLITCLFALKVVLQYFSYTTSTLVMYSAFNVVDYINTIMLFQYIDLVLLIRQRFVWINQRLEDVCKYSHPINLDKHKRPLVPVLSIKTTKLSPISRFDVLLENLANIYSKLCDVSRLVNRAYNIQILVTVGSRFVMITIQLINIYRTIRDPDKGNVAQYLVLSVYLILHIGKIFMVACICENTSFKVRLKHSIHFN
ncbi:hypothetical protein AMK59_6729 [Oryctes borbonicus]|uniref:Gustatory receptor n=1 Tax=Oryctes borbonicus TaxID=1629725 RepID=A0A0T6AX93_9SCAR|nr:hypothetical protein AMK59_6729 [Oryctes borbonicus]